MICLPFDSDLGGIVSVALLNKVSIGITKFSLLLLVSWLYVAMNSVLAQSPTIGLVASYPFNGNANDESGNGNNGTVNGATLTTDRFGKSNSAYSFDGVGNYIQTPISFTPGSESKSFSVWFSVASDSYYWVIGGGSDLTSQAFGLFYNINATKRLTFHGHTATYDYEFGSVNLNEWNNATITYDGISIKTYINGQYIGSKTVALNTTSGANIKIGTRPNNSAFFKGKIDDIKIYNKALTASEITALYNDNNSGLVAHYPFNGNANDESGNGNNGTVNGATLTTDRFGKANSAYSFDGNDFIEIPKFPNINTFSISLFTKTSLSYTESGTIINKGNESIDNKNVSYRIYYDPEYNLAADLWTPTRSYLTFFDSVATTWHNIIFTFDGKKQSLFINGKIRSSKALTGSLFQSSESLLIGVVRKVMGGLSYYYKGNIDDISIYNHELSSSEISDINSQNTCIQTITVTDTLRISKVTGFNTLPENFGNIKVYPNPTNDVLTINISNPNADYRIKILDNLGKAVYTTPMNSANLQINLNQFTARGLYLIQIINKENQILDVRKLVLE